MEKLLNLLPQIQYFKYRSKVSEASHDNLISANQDFDESEASLVDLGIKSEWWRIDVSEASNIQSIV